jgi:hypothetical protein
MTHKILTKDLFVENTVKHPVGGYYVRLTNEKTEISIVGGRKGLYGDFINTFELAIIDLGSKKFITKEILNSSDDVCPFMSFDQLVEVVDKVYENGFQFIRG